MAILQVVPFRAEIALQRDLTCHAFYSSVYRTGVDTYIEFRVARAMFKGIEFSYEDSPSWDAWHVWRKTLNL